MNYILFDDKTRSNLLPLTFTRPVSLLRIGIDTIQEKWEYFIKANTSFLTEEYLSEKYPVKEESENILINGSVIPDNLLFNEINKLNVNDLLVKDNWIIAGKLLKKDINKIYEVNTVNKKEYKNKVIKVNNLWDIFTLNGEILKEDFKRLASGKKTEKISNTVNVIGSPDNIFIKPGAKLEFITLNTTNGPVFIGENAEIMEGSVIRGPFALGEHSTVKIGAKIYGPTTVGPHCKVGGEINNCVFIGYSNKGHDGFLGNAVLGEWCNIGADSNNSNLKNNYASVKLWNYNEKRFIDTGLQFCGLIMGDHSKCGINTMFNTGTVVGVNANIFGTGFPRNFVPSFSWGGAAGFSIYKVDKAFEVAEKVMQRRDIELSETDKRILNKVFELTSGFRNF
ncbi:MAG: glucose-1-phosphate thymidylyltransferase [Chlorobi bacterium]|nr:glucose-1-phosphate thymidylyltransferase [Chlorobiota bacterium]